ncbi:MAG TPA: amidase family protein [Steroidobacteraceae bacterium]|jgi:Asp-tRNA(Asn)/Glu-tRNA(Gln) amidotransferase A subunit family amidase
MSFEVKTGLIAGPLVCLLLAATPVAAVQAKGFELIEATIDSLHQAIRRGDTTCKAVVQSYVDRAKVYNGVSDRLVTVDGAPVAKAVGTVRAGSPLSFPTETVSIATLLPDYAQYSGPPIELGRMEATASDPSVQQQYGMTIGTPNSRQANALGTLNLRGERSVTCKGDFDRSPAAGALPAGAPAVCEEFRKQPDALERAAELDKQYGHKPDLAAMPMYCVPFSFKDPYDTADMRSTGAGDARYDIDFPSRDHLLVSELRKKGAIIYAKAVNTEYNGIPPNDDGRNKPAKILVSDNGYQRSSWSGNPNTPYDSTRAASLGSSSGSGVSVSTNLVMCSLCEETSMSCRGPSNHNSVALLLPHKSLISFIGGAIGADIHNDRAGIICRNITDAAKVLDALRDPKTGYYDPRDVFTTVPRSSVLADSYASHAATPGSTGSLKGVRIGVIRESMLVFPGVKADEPIVHAAAKEIKEILGKQLGATLVESADPLWADDPDIENMTVDYTRAIAELVPLFYPDVLYRLTGAGAPMFPEFAAAIRPTEFAVGKTFGSGAMAPIDYMLQMAEGRIPPPKNLNVRTILQLAQSNAFTYQFNQYASRRAADWAARGFTETLTDWPALNARSKYWSDEQRAWFKNWEETTDMRNAMGERQGVTERIMLRELLRRVEMKVIQENRLDVVVRLHTSLPPGKIGLAPQPGPRGNTRGELRFGPYAGVTEVLVPAGYVTTAYDPTFVLSADKKSYVATNNNAPTTIASPGLPFSLVFRAEPGAEDRILKVASAYEAASKRRVPPPLFGALGH